jgi:hypothetical protein
MSHHIANETPNIAMGELGIECFESYVQFLYLGLRTDHLNVEPNRPAFTGNGTKVARKKALEKSIDDSARAEYIAVCKLYIFCGRVQDLEAKKVLLSALVKAIQTTRDDGMVHYPGKEVAKLIYEGTSPADPIREFLVDCHAIAGLSDWNKGQSAADYPPQFLFDLTIAMFKYRPEPDGYLHLEDESYYCDKVQM